MKNQHRKIPIVNISYNSLPELDMLSQDPKFTSYIYEQVVEAIKDGITNNKNKVDICQLGMSNQFITIDRSNWKPSLDTVIKMFETENNYEKCFECSELKKRI